jgi:hypothetical protein
MIPKGMREMAKISGEKTAGSIDPMFGGELGMTAQVALALVLVFQRVRILNPWNEENTKTPTL